MSVDVKLLLLEAPSSDNDQQKSLSWPVYSSLNVRHPHANLLFATYYSPESAAQAIRAEIAAVHGQRIIIRLGRKRSDVIGSAICSSFLTRLGGHGHFSCEGLIAAYWCHPADRQEMFQLMTQHNISWALEYLNPLNAFEALWYEALWLDALLTADIESYERQNFVNLARSVFTRINGQGHNAQGYSLGNSIRLWFRARYQAVPEDLSPVLFTQ